MIWTGSQANDLFGNTIPIYAPDPYEGGSSLSHVDQNNGGFDGLMNYSISDGVIQREMHDVELAMLEDMGWDTTVPEPATMILLGLGSTMLLKRRKRAA